MGPKGGSYSWYRNRIFQDFDEMKGDHPAGIRMKVAHTAGTETITITVQGRRSGPAACAERLNKRKCKKMIKQQMKIHITTYITTY